jgi:hypothetical protein
VKLNHWICEFLYINSFVYNISLWGAGKQDVCIWSNCFFSVHDKQYIYMLENSYRGSNWQENTHTLQVRNGIQWSYLAGHFSNGQVPRSTSNCFCSLVSERPDMDVARHRLQISSALQNLQPAGYDYIVRTRKWLFRASPIGYSVVDVRIESYMARQSNSLKRIYSPTGSWLFQHESCPFVYILARESNHMRFWHPMICWFWYLRQRVSFRACTGSTLFTWKENWNRESTTIATGYPMSRGSDLVWIRPGP